MLQQLLQLRIWQDKVNATASEKSISYADASTVPAVWELTRGIALYDWQERCIDAWFANGKRGIIKVVTGAGKTLLALAIAEKLQQTEAPQLRLAIVVPTIVLMDQWREELLTRSNLPAEAIALMGGTYDFRVTESTRILICVLNSAASKLARVVDQNQIGDNLLLIVDECHRAGAAQMQRVFQTKRTFSLGLSATPERETDPDAETEHQDENGDSNSVPFDETVLGRQLGSVIFELSYAQAIDYGILPQFVVVHYGLSLTSEERYRYDRISAEIRELRKELEGGRRTGLALIRWCRSRAAAKNPKAARFISLTGERKRLLYHMRSRATAVRKIVAQATQDSESRGILFHESIEQVMMHFAELQSLGCPVVAEHSEFPDNIRAESLRLFRNGTARILVSAKSLIEGFNVPAADFGIIVAASASVRQRVQTLGRLLRKYRKSDTLEKRPTLYVLYAAETVDELIYEKADWDKFVGPERSEYYVWRDVEHGQPIRTDGPPRLPKLSESAINHSLLQEGGIYPGSSDEGKQYSVDMQGNVRDDEGSLMLPDRQLQQMLSIYIQKGGRFRITPKNRFVLKLTKTSDGWQSTYLGKLQSPLVRAENSDWPISDNICPGDPYPLGLAKGKTFSVLQRDPRLIALKTRLGARFVIPADKLSDPQKSTALRQIQNRLAELYANGRRMSKITVTSQGHVVCVFGNAASFIGFAPEGAAGFLIEDEEQFPVSKE